MYTLRDFNDTDVAGRFYRWQLKKITRPQKPVVKKILRKDPRRKRTLVQLRDYPHKNKGDQRWVSNNLLRSDYGFLGD